MLILLVRVAAPLKHLAHWPHRGHHHGPDPRLGLPRLHLDCGRDDGRRRLGPRRNRAHRRGWVRSAASLTQGILRRKHDGGGRRGDGRHHGEGGGGCARQARTGARMTAWERTASLSRGRSLESRAAPAAALMPDPPTGRTVAWTPRAFGVELLARPASRPRGHCGAAP